MKELGLFLTGMGIAYLSMDNLLGCFPIGFGLFFIIMDILIENYYKKKGKEPTR